ncbi:MAG: hypothetical protein K2H93_06105 [Oscillospiraceae bacterium]|nr:hypothetical protein [Ruminococcus sp.]MDE5737921.1 hypothetical protein [Oscillospiraceae bacterium]MDE6706575.1 hypothetical protein [Oscillospiraceae bacterium]
MGDKKNKKKNYYLVDYENVHKAGLNGIEELHRTDTVIIFYSENADSLSFELHHYLANTKAVVKYIKVDTDGKNALDFQLSSYIGYLIGRNEHCKCYIVSNDKGYYNVQDFWLKRDAKIKIVSCVKPQVNNKGIKKSDILDVLQSISLTEEEKNQTAEVVKRQLKTGASQLSQLKVNINNELIHYFGTEKTKKIYAVIKPLIK